MTNYRKRYDLEERTAKFGEMIVVFAKQISKNQITRSIIDQLVRSDTSIGANYCEADCAESKKTSNINSALLKKKRKKQNIGLE